MDSLCYLGSYITGNRNVAQKGTSRVANCQTKII